MRCERRALLLLAAVSAFTQHTHTAHAATPNYKIHLSQLPPLPAHAPLGVPTLVPVTLTNTYTRQSLTIYDATLTSSTSDFALPRATYSSPVSIPPRGEHSVDVLLTPRTLGPTRAELLLNTSAGALSANLSAESNSNPFRLKPLHNFRVSAGAKYTPTIRLHNPFDEPLAVSEVSTSEAFLHLALPLDAPASADGDEDDATIVLQPGETRSIVSIIFSEDKPGDYQGHVHIEMEAESGGAPHVVVVPTLVTVGASELQPLDIDFGVMTTPKLPVELPLELTSSATSPIEILDVGRVDTHLSHMIDIRLSSEPGGRVLQPDVPRVVGTVSLRPSAEGLFSGSLHVTTNTSTSAVAATRVAYYGQAMFGAIEWSALNTSFDASPERSTLTVSNALNSPIRLVSAAIDGDAHGVFVVADFQRGAVLEPGWALDQALTLSYHPAGPRQSYTCLLKLSTNASELVIPLHVHKGGITARFDTETASSSSPSPTPAPPLHRLSRDVSIGEQNVYPILLSNPSAIETRELRSILLGGFAQGSVARPCAVITLASKPDGEQPGKLKVNMRMDVPYGTSRHPSSLPLMRLLPGAEVRFELWIDTAHKACAAPRPVQANITFISSKNSSDDGSDSTHEYEAFLFYQYTTRKGHVTATSNTLKMGPAFPGVKCRAAISAKSTFTEPVEVTSIYADNPSFVTRLTEAHLAPRKVTRLGEVLFDPELVLPSATRGKQPPFGQALLSREVGLLRQRQMAWADLRAKGSILQSATVTVLTPVASLEMVASAKLMWPEFIAGGALETTAVRVGRKSASYLRFRNHADVPVTYELVIPASTALSDEALLSWVHVRNINRLTSIMTEAVRLPGSFSIPRHAQGSLTVPPKQEVQLGPIVFAPTSAAYVRSELYIRNNLTGLEEVLLHGEGHVTSIAFLTDAAAARTAEGGLPGGVEDEVSQLRFAIGEPELIVAEDSLLRMASAAIQIAPTARALSPTLYTHSFFMTNRGKEGVDVTNMRLQRRNAQANPDAPPGWVCSFDGVAIVKGCGRFALPPDHVHEFIFELVTDFDRPNISLELVLEVNEEQSVLPVEIELATAALPRCRAALRAYESSQTASERGSSPRRVFVVLAALLLVAATTCWWLVNADQGGELSPPGAKLQQGLLVLDALPDALRHGFATARSVIKNAANSEECVTAASTSPLRRASSKEAASPSAAAPSAKKANKTRGTGSATQNRCRPAVSGGAAAVARSPSQTLSDVTREPEDANVLRAGSVRAVVDFELDDAAACAAPSTKSDLAYQAALASEMNRIAAAINVADIKPAAAGLEATEDEKPHDAPAPPPPVAAQAATLQPCKTSNPSTAAPTASKSRINSEPKYEPKGMRAAAADVAASISAGADGVSARVAPSAPAAPAAEAPAPALNMRRGSDVAKIAPRDRAALAKAQSRSVDKEGKEQLSQQQQRAKPAAPVDRRKSGDLGDKRPPSRRIASCVPLCSGRPRPQATSVAAAADAVAVPTAVPSAVAAAAPPEAERLTAGGGFFGSAIDDHRHLADRIERERQASRNVTATGESERTLVAREPSLSMAPLPSGLDELLSGDEPAVKLSSPTAGVIGARQAQPPIAPLSLAVSDGESSPWGQLSAPAGNELVGANLLFGGLPGLSHSWGAGGLSSSLGSGSAASQPFAPSSSSPYQGFSVNGEAARRDEERELLAHASFLNSPLL